MTFRRANDHKEENENCFYIEFIFNIFETTVLGNKWSFCLPVPPTISLYFFFCSRNSVKRSLRGGKNE